MSLISLRRLVMFALGDPLILCALSDSLRLLANHQYLNYFPTYCYILHILLMESSITRQLNFPGVLAIGDFRIFVIAKDCHEKLKNSVSDFPLPPLGIFWRVI